MTGSDSQLLAVARDPFGLDSQASRLSRLLDDGATVDVLGRDGATPLLLVAKTGSLEALDVLLARGADLHHRDAKGNTALHYATASLGVRQDLVEKLLPERRAIVQRLLDGGLSPNEPADGIDGRTPFWNAAGNLPSEFAKALLDRGADPLITTTDRSHRSPLDIAVQQGQLATVELLLRHDVIATEAQLKFAVHKNDFAIAALLRKALHLPQPGAEAPLAHLRSLASRLGEEAHSSAADSGDLDHHENDDDLDPDDLVDDYWDGSYRATLVEAFEVLPDTARRELPALDELILQLYKLYAEAFRAEL